MAAAPAVDRTFSGPARLQGVDLARGFAVLGMLAAHLATLPEWDWSDPLTWVDVANGRSSILFAVLAGVAIALVSGGTAPLARGPRLTRTRVSLAVRAIVLWTLGIVLIATGVPVFVILPTYGLLFLFSLPLLRMDARALWVLAGVLALVMPWVQPALDAPAIWEGEVGWNVSLVLGWHYPFTVWSAFLVAGMAAARSDLAARRTQLLLLGAGVALTALGYGADAVIGTTAAQEQASYLSAVLTASPHSSGLLEVIGSGGLALASIALCQLACRLRTLAALSLPLRAVGSMPLTAYVGQLVAWAVIAGVVLGDVGDLSGMRALHLYWPFVLVTVAFCTVWALWRGRGPLETALDRLTRWLVPR